MTVVVWHRALFLSTVGEIVEVVAGRVVAVGAQVLARRAVDHANLGAFPGPGNVVGVRPGFDVGDRVCLGPWRPGVFNSLCEVSEQQA